MNPWSHADDQGRGESLERELFARRAEALGPAEVPSLASVLRAVEGAREAANEAKERSAVRGARGRTFVATLLAAACMMAALTRLPRMESIEASEGIAADVDAGRPANVPEALPGAECTLRDEVLFSEERACFAPAPLFTPAPVFTAAPAVTAAPAARSLFLAHTCEAEESCSIAPP